MSDSPAILEKKPKPVHRQRFYHNRPLMVWEGVVLVDKVSGWADNPRIELAVEAKKSIIGNRDLSQDEIFEIMKSEKDIKLDDLRNNIAANRVREPITLTSDGKLLDGNRRYFAVRYLLEGMSTNDPQRLDFAAIPAFVLDESCSHADEMHILVEENFTASFKEAWPDSVKASRIRRELDEGATIQDVVNKYGWPRHKVKETDRIGQLIDDFLLYATAPPDPEDESGGGLGLSETAAKRIASVHYQKFNQAQKSFFDDLKADLDFKFCFFKWIEEGKFRSFDEIKAAYRAWKDPEARLLLAGKQPTAAKDAKAIIDYKDRVEKGMVEVPTRVRDFVRFLGELTSEQMSAMPPEAVENLRHALERVLKMAESVRND